MNIFHNITFKTEFIKRNYDIITDGDNIITEYNGYINKIRINERKPPLVVGEYFFSSWNLELAKFLKIDIVDLLYRNKIQTTYNDMYHLIQNKLIDISKYRKILFLHGMVIHSEYRGIGITDEFIEFLFRDFYENKTGIFALVYPIQNNIVDFDFFKNHNFVKIREKIGNLKDFQFENAFKYYGLDKFMKMDDFETNQLKLFSVAKRCGFNRINESNLFEFNPKIVVERIEKKQNIL